LFLTSQDFHIQRGTQGPILCHSIRDFSLIMFYSTRCKWCQTLIPIFKRLPGTIGGCQFGMVNIDNNRQCVEMSKSTQKTVINYVPLIIFYVNGKPLMKYDKNLPYTLENLQKFVIGIANNILERQKFIKHKNTGVTVPESELARTWQGIGIPVCSGGVCYLPNCKAYPQIRSQ